MATLKTCFKCHEAKPLSEFYKHAMMGDGHLGKCKDCTKRDVRKHRAANDSVREYDRERAKDPKRIANRKAIIERWTALFPNRKRAHGVLARAVRTGRLTRLPCWTCGAEDTEAHHADYDQPLDVIWLCVRHHRQLHGELKTNWRDLAA